MEFTPDSIFIRDLETRAIIATGVVDHSSRLYYFDDFASPSVSIPTAVQNTPIVHHHSERRVVFLNLAVVTSDLVLEPSIPSPPPTIAIVDTSMATHVVPSVSVQHDLVDHSYFEVPLHSSSTLASSLFEVTSYFEETSWATPH